jgi:hypothetical protein
MNPKLAVFLLGCGLAVQVFATNLVTNGDFEAGNTGFSTDYTYFDPGEKMFGGTNMDAGYYSVVSNANHVHAGFSGGPEAGFQFLVANGAVDTSQSVWKSEVISVTETNQAYRFEAYISSVVPPSLAPPSLSFEIGNGTTWTALGMTPSLAGAPMGQWFFSYADGIFQQAGDFIIRLRNDSNILGGNDLGVDSIYFGLRSSAPSFGSNPGTTPAIFNPSAVPEPSTGALLAMGIGGLMAWRRVRRS